MRTWKFIAPESNGKYWYGVTLEDETPKFLDNIGEGRRAEHRWVRATQATLLNDYIRGTVFNVAFSPRALGHVLNTRTGLGRIEQVMAAAERQHAGPVNAQPAPTQAVPIEPGHDVMMPSYNDARGHHHRAPRRFPTQ